MIVIRPFAKFDANLVLIECELTFLVLSAILIYLNKEERWTRTIEYAYVGIIFSCSATTAITVLSKPIMNHFVVVNASRLIQKLCSKRRSKITVS